MKTLILLGSASDETRSTYVKISVRDGLNTFEPLYNKFCWRTNDPLAPDGCDYP